ncbi:MAG TPA: nuclear transport factor 2 family protein [Kofleriaceae bacterium]
MSRNLEPSIAQYIEGVNAFDADLAATGFAVDAVVHDEGRDHAGLAAIRAWIQDANTRYSTQIAIDTLTQQGDATVVHATISGRFPGSPLPLRFSFQLHAGRIQRLEIAP